MSGVNRMKISVYSFLFLMLLAGSPALAQVDLSGEWSPNRAHEDQTPRPNVLPGDYAGMPINDNARARADAWTATRWTLPEWQCRPHPLGYLERGPSGTEDLAGDRSRLTGSRGHPHGMAAIRRLPRYIWMDGPTLRKTPRTAGVDFRPASGSEMSSRSARPTSKKAT